MIGTNTFSSTTIAMADYEMEDFVYELNYEGARLAREVCDEVTAEDPANPRFVVSVKPKHTSTHSSLADLVSNVRALSIGLCRIWNLAYRRRFLQALGNATAARLYRLFES